MANTFLTRDNEDESRADERGEKLDELLRALPAGLGATIRTLSVEADPRIVFEGLWKTSEILAQHLARLVNSNYMARAVADEATEKAVRDLNNTLRGKAGPSFGHYIAGIRAFSRQASPWLMDGLSEVVRGKLDSSAATFVAAVPHLNDAKQKFNVPPDKLALYVKEHLGGGTRATVTLDGFLSAVVQLRNSLVHPKTPTTGGEAPEAAPSEGENVHWCRTVNHYLAPALCDLLLGDPLFNFLIQFQVVETVGARLAGTPSPPYAVRWPLAAQPPTGLGKMTAASDVSLSPQDRVVAKVVGPTRGRLDFVARWHQFPTSRNSMDKAREVYRHAFAAKLFDEDALTLDDREFLRQRLAELLLAAGDVKDDEQAIWDLCHGVAAWALAPDGGNVPPALAEYRGDGEGKLPLADDLLREHMIRCVDAWGGLVLNTLDDQGAQTPAEIALNSGLTFALVQLAIDKLKNNPELAPVVNKGKWARPNRELESRLVDLLATTKSLLDEKQVLDNYVWDLLVLAAELMDVAAQSGEKDGATTFGVRVSTMREDYATADVIASTSEAPDMASASGADPDVLARGIGIEINGQFVQAAGLARLQRKLGPILEQRAQAVLAYLQEPHAVGNSRCFVALKPEHANGKPFGYDVKIQVAGQDVFFEANFPKNNGLFLLGQFLRECGFSVATGTAESIEPEAQTAAPVSGDVVAALQVNLLQPEDNRVVLAAGKTVGEFLGAVFAGLLELSGPKLRQLLPCSMGRVRYLVALAPFHKDDAPFRKSIQVDDLYVEAHLSRLHALTLVNDLCDKLGVECRDTAEEDDEDEDSVAPADIAMADGNTETVAAEAVELAVTLQDNEVVAGKTVREFFRALLDMCARRGWISQIPMPFRASDSRNLLDKDALHGNGRPFRFAVPYEWSGGTFQVEINFDRPRALDVARKLVATVEGAALAGAVAQDAPNAESSPAYA